MTLLHKLFELLKNLLTARPKPTDQRNLLGMYFGESNSGGRRKANRDRA